MTKVEPCYDCGSNVYKLKRRNYPMFNEDGTRDITKTYQCQMCYAEFLADGTPVEHDKKQTMTSCGSHGYHKLY